MNFLVFIIFLGAAVYVSARWISFVIRSGCAKKAWFVPVLNLAISLSLLAASLIRHDLMLEALSVALLVVNIVTCMRELTQGRLLKSPKEKTQSQTASVPSPSEEERMKALFLRVETFMQEGRPYLESDFGEEDMANEMYTNKAYLSRTVNRLSGHNFCQYVNSYRIRYAVELFKSDARLKVSEVSLMSGFHTVVSFNMAFKLHMHCTPSEYQRNLQAEKLQ